MRIRRRAIPRVQPSLMRAAAVLLTAAGCVPPPAANEATVNVQQSVAAGDLTKQARLTAGGVYSVLTWVGPGAFVFFGCVPDVSGGARCTFRPYACPELDDGATLTMHEDKRPDGTEQVSAIAVTGMMRTTDVPDTGAVVELLHCGLAGSYPDTAYGVVMDFLASEIYTTTLVPWPYADPPATRADTVLALSRLDMNRGAVGNAITGLGQSLALGEDTASVVTTAVVEAAFVLGLHLAIAPGADSLHKAVPFIWPHGAGAYATDTAVLRRGIELLDFAAQVPNSGVDWQEVPQWGWPDQELVFTHTPSIAAMEEMNGTAHYLLGRALATRAQAAPSCAAWRDADEALQTGYSYLRATPRIDAADETDEHLAEAASQAVQQADSARLGACQGAAS